MFVRRALIGLVLLGFVATVTSAKEPAKEVVPMKNGNFTVIGATVQTMIGPPVEFRVGVGLQGPPQMLTYKVELWIGADTPETIALGGSAEITSGQTGISFANIVIEPPWCDTDWWWFIVIKTADGELLTWTDTTSTKKP